MPLTGAEKTRRYREKLKITRPEEYAAQCQRKLNKLKSSKKKISEMTPEEAEEQRKKWRNAKKRSNSKKKQKKNELITTIIKRPETVPDSDNTNVINILRRRCRFLAKKCRNLEQNEKKLKTKKETYKKQLFRLKIKDTEERKKLNLIIDKMRAREEVLESTLQNTYKSLQSHHEKKILKKIVENSNNKAATSKMLGLTGKARGRKKRLRRVNIDEITKFYSRDDVSRITSGRKETKTRNKEKNQIRYLTGTLIESYKKYKNEGGRYGFTTFFRYKPFYVLSPHLNARDTCLCIKHSNLEFQYTTLWRYRALTTNLSDTLSQVACDTNNYRCMYDKCDLCKNKKLQFEGHGLATLDVTWFCWEKEDYIYTKKDGNEQKEVKTKKTKKVQKSGKLEDLQLIFDKEIHNFKKHKFNMQHQHTQYRKAIDQLKENEVVIVCDFSESYEAKLAAEIQAMHFGASKNQITLHTGMVYWQKQSQSFCTISESNNHQPPAIWAHLKPIIDLIQQNTPQVDVIHFFSDGPSSQYRQKNNFFLLTHFTKKFQIRFATWSYFEAGHGKSVADGIGGSVKRTLDRRVSEGVDVADAKDAFEILKKCLKITKVFFIPDSDIANISKILPKNIQQLKGTLQVHQVFTQEDETLAIKYRDVSCFCEPYRGNCNCFLPQTHYVVSQKPAPIDITLTPAKNQHKTQTIETKDTAVNLPELVAQTFETSDLESLKNLDVGKTDLKEVINIEDIDVMPIIIVKELIKTDQKVPGKENRHINKQTIDGRNKCKKCKVRLQGRKTKCMACQENYCEECTDDYKERDYLCDSCLEGGD